jgi:hypothetical protein
MTLKRGIKSINDSKDKKTRETHSGIEFIRVQKTGRYCRGIGHEPKPKEVSKNTQYYLDDDGIL